MVPFLFGERADAVDEGEGGGEVGEGLFKLEVMFVDHAPAGGELGLEILQFRAFQRRNASFAGDAFLGGETGHVARNDTPTAGPLDSGFSRNWQFVCFFRPPEVRLSQKQKILVVDDDDAIRTMVERILRREQFDVEGARDGYEAIEKLTRNDYGTILLDLMMPRVDGHGVLRFLETHPAPARVIVMTANTQGGSEAAEAKPVFRVLSKPFDIKQLIENVRECVTVGA